MARRTLSVRRLPALAALLAATTAATTAGAEETRDSSYYQSYIYGVPADASEVWQVAYGGRLYDIWWVPLGKEPPERAHPSYRGRQAGNTAATWRCVTCHGWDYRGRGGVKGLDAMIGADPARVAAVVRGPDHGYTADMIADAPLQALALFVTRGQYDLAAHVDDRTRRIRGDVDRGRGLYQNACAICHDFDGRAWIYGEGEEQNTLAAIALSDPMQVLHKTLNGVPNADMPAMRAFDLQTVLDVLAYAQTLPAR